MDLLSEKLEDLKSTIINAVLFLKTLSKQEIQTYFQEQFENLEDFFLDMNFELAHDYLFMPAHYPTFFIIQAIFTCILIKKYYPKTNWSTSFTAGYLVLMLGRNLVGFITGVVPPTLQNPSYTISYTLIWFLINKFPFDLFYKTFKSFIFYIPMQLFMALIAVRESTYGIDMGFRVFPNSVPGALGLSIVLCCTESIVWRLIFEEEVREYSSWAILRNIIVAVLYIIVTKYSEFLESFMLFTLTKENIKIFELIACLALVIIDDVIFGLQKNYGLGNKLTKLLSYLPYHGGVFVSKKMDI